MADSNSSFVVERILNLLEEKNKSDRKGDDDDDDAEDYAAEAEALSSDATTESASIDVRCCHAVSASVSCVHAIWLCLDACGLSTCRAVLSQRLASFLLEGTN